VSEPATKLELQDARADSEEAEMEQYSILLDVYLDLQWNQRRLPLLAIHHGDDASRITAKHERSSPTGGREVLP
jgi:hypothetical protein